MKAGIYYEYNINSEGFSATCFSGCLDFTSNSKTAAQNPFNTNHPYANALLGYYTTYAESNTRPFRGANQWNFEWFAQDSWKVRTNLTLELGVRFASGTPWHLNENGWKGYNPPPGERAAAWLAEAYDAAAQSDPLRSGVCAAGHHVRGHGAAGEESAHRPDPAELRRAHRTAGARQRRLLQRIDSRQRCALERRHVPAQSRIRAQPRLGFSWDPTGSRQTAIRGGYGITEQLFDASGTYAGTFPSSVPVRLQPTLFYGSLSDLASVPSVFSPSPVSPVGQTGGRTRDDAQLLDRGAAERRLQHGRHRGVRRQSPARPAHDARTGTWCPRVPASTRRPSTRPARPAPAAGRLPAADSAVHQRHRAHAGRGHRLRLAAGDGEPSSHRAASRSAPPIRWRRPRA